VRTDGVLLPVDHLLHVLLVARSSAHVPAAHGRADDASSLHIHAQKVRHYFTYAGEYVIIFHISCTHYNTTHSLTH
jgi:hypothetical protein